MLGTSEWENEFYRTDSQAELGLGFAPIKSRDVDRASVSKFLLGRLAKVFYQVHPTARVLINSKKNLFIFCALRAATKRAQGPR
jgi:hypothetical protein